MCDPNSKLSYAEGGIVAPRGFLAAGVCAGIKKSGKRDLCLLVSESRAACAAVYTVNQMAAPPISVCRENLADGVARAVVINSGNANACTGAPGMAAARAMAEETARLLEVDAADVAVASTGVIGVQLPLSETIAGIAEAVEALDNATGDAAAEAIMTTDTFPKQTAVLVECEDRAYTVGGMAKGSGMIRPDMATMLAFLTTDAPLTSEACDAALSGAVGLSFNRITVDGETSTNDMCLLLANGAAGGAPISPDDPRFPPIAEAVRVVCAELARMIVRDGEGATKFIEITVNGATSDSDAELAAMAVADSLLFKCAVFGGDANWGRVVSAVGASRAKIDPDAIEVEFAGVLTCRNGTAVSFDEDEASAALSADEIEVVIDLHVGDGTATVWTCDMSYDYVRINADYRT